MRRVTYEDILAQAQEHRDQHTLGLDRKSFAHLKATFKSLTRFVRRGAKNPRFVEQFVDNFAGFARWSLKNGFALDKELELVGPYLVEGTKLEFQPVVEWTKGKPRFDREYTLHSVEDENPPEILPDDWVTDYREFRWVKQDQLARRKTKPLLTNYGYTRLRARRKPLKLTCFGETKTSAQWAKDTRCQVTDKILKNRKNSGWSDCDAITLGPRQSPTQPKVDQ